MSITIDALKSKVFPGESGGDYDALFGFANRPGGEFEGVKLSGMTVDQALDFANPSGAYGQSVKRGIGRVATPMGAYQVVGTTLRDAKRGLGLSGNEVLTPELQDLIGLWIHETQGPGAWAGWGKGGGSDGAPAAPRGLLSTTEEPQTFGEKLKSKWQSGELLDGIALAANSLRLDPDPNLAQIIHGRQQQRADTATTNRTVQWLQSQGRADLAHLLTTGAIDAKSAVAMAYDKPDPVKGVEVGGNLVNPETGEIMYTGSPDQKDAFSTEIDMMKAYRSDPIAQNFFGTGNYYGRMISAYDEIGKNPGQPGSGDLAIVYSYMKMLDPGSTVMQGEYATASNTAGVSDIIRNTYNKIIEGSKLGENQRIAFIRQAGAMMQKSNEAMAKTNETYLGSARRYGVNTDFIVNPVTIRDFKIPQTVEPIPVQPPAGKTFMPNSFVPAIK